MFIVNNTGVTAAVFCKEAASGATLSQKTDELNIGTRIVDTKIDNGIQVGVEIADPCAAESKSSESKGDASFYATVYKHRAFKATNLWLRLVSDLETKLPRAPHSVEWKWGRRTVLPCFTGAELVNWLCGYITAHPDFEHKEGITCRERAEALANKLYACNYFVRAKNALKNIDSFDFSSNDSTGDVFSISGVGSPLPVTATGNSSLSSSKSNLWTSLSAKLSVGRVSSDEAEGSPMSLSCQSGTGPHSSSSFSFNSSKSPEFKTGKQLYILRVDWEAYGTCRRRVSPTIGSSMLDKTMTPSPRYTARRNSLPGLTAFFSHSSTELDQNSLLLTPEGRNHSHTNMMYLSASNSSEMSTSVLMSPSPRMRAASSSKALAMLGITEEDAIHRDVVVLAHPRKFPSKLRKAFSSAHI